jgi:hypothetical protein
MTGSATAVRRHQPNLTKYHPTLRHMSSTLWRHLLIEQRIAVIGGTSGIGFAVESKELHWAAWPVGQPGDAF